jgi:hypothetical protein
MSTEILERGDRIRPKRANWTRKRRTLDERVLVQFPAVARRLIAFLSRLPTGSRPRRSLLVRLATQIASAANRRDWDVLLLAVDPEVRYRADVGTGGYVPDLVGEHHGHTGYLHVWRNMLEGFEDLTIESEELIDLGDRVISATRLSGHGVGSGIPMEMRLFQVFTLRKGLIFRQLDLADRGAALDAAGLSE